MMRLHIAAVSVGALGVLAAASQQAGAAPAAKLAVAADQRALVQVHYDGRRHKHRQYREGAVVRAPFAYVDTRGRRTWVDAPFTAVRVHRRGVWVRAPFVDIYVPR